MILSYNQLDYYYSHKLYDLIREDELMILANINRKLVVNKDGFKVYIKRREYDDEQWVELYSWKPREAFALVSAYYSPSSGLRDYLKKRIKNYLGSAA